VVEYDKREMTNPVSDLILGFKIMKELGFDIDPMSDINSLENA
jgi:hypothetical protein